MFGLHLFFTYCTDLDLTDNARMTGGRDWFFTATPRKTQAMCGVAPPERQACLPDQASAPA
jgi:hypothetical protein